MEISFLLPFSAYPPTYISPRKVCDLLENIEKNGIVEFGSAQDIELEQLIK